MATTAAQTNGNVRGAQMTDTPPVPFGAGHALGAAAPSLDAVLSETQRRRLAMMPRDMAELWDMAERVAQSGWAPKAFNNNINTIFIAMMHGNEVGLPPLASLRAIAVVNGSPVLFGDGALAVVRSSGVMEDFEETMEWDGDVPVNAVCRIKRKGQKTEIVRSFSRANAQKANLWSKAGPWTQYPQRMLQMRARAWALRDGFADVLSGLAIAEEAMDFDDVIAATPPAAARQAVATAPAVPVTPGTVAEALKSVEVEKERFGLFDQHGDQICEYTDPAQWVAGLADLLADPKRADGREWLLANNRDMADDIAAKYADCRDSIEAMYAVQEPAEINFDTPAQPQDAPPPAADTPVQPTEPTPPQRKPVPKFTISDAPTWLTFRSKMEAEIRAADIPDADWVTELMRANKERIAGGPSNQQQALRSIAAQRWRELGGKGEGAAHG